MDWKLEVIVVPVSDVNRAKQFYAEKVGFAVDHDTQVSENYRIVQLTPRGSGCSIVIGTDNQHMASGSLKGLQLVVSDIQAAHLHLTSHGVEVGAIQHFEGSTLADGPGGPWNSFIFFSDPDGNEWAVQERPSA